MTFYDHLPLPEYRGNLRRKKGAGRPIYEFPKDRNKQRFYTENAKNAEEIARSFQGIKSRYEGKLQPHLIYRLRINQGVHYESFEKRLYSLGGLTVLSVAEDRKGYWVVFADDEQLKIFKDKLAQYSGIKQGHKYEFFNAIDEISDIPEEEKVGELLRRQPLQPGEIAYLNVELWRMDNEILNVFTNELTEVYNDTRLFKITDRLVTNSFALFRMRVSTEIYQEILRLKEVAHIDRPYVPVFQPYEYNQIDASDFDINPPNDDACGILILDTGVVSNHPMLENTIGAEEDFQGNEKEIHDSVGHGTAVAGIASYGSIEECIRQRSFTASNWIFSAKIMYGKQNFQGQLQAVYDPGKLFESQIRQAIKTFLDTPSYRIKAVNMSFGNKLEILKEQNNRQFPLAALVDELAYEYDDVVFVVSAGNEDPTAIYEGIDEILDSYPDYLVDNPNFKIINPATSALSLTVGSTAPPERYFDPGMGTPNSNIWVPIAKENEPSPYTRSGYGINGMIKPELTHYGGNLIVADRFGYVMKNIGGKLTVLSNDPVDKLFAFDLGTSLAAPQVTHLVGRIANKYPHKSANFIKNVILQSASHLTLPEFEGTLDTKRELLLKIQGYGLPNYERAVFSFANRVVLLDEGEIGLNEVKVFSVNVPTAFFAQTGDKVISVALTFDPPTRATRGDSYLGNRMEFKLFHSVNPEAVVDKYAEIDIAVDDTTPLDLAKYEIKLLPGVNRRKAGCHQKGWKKYQRRPRNLPQPPVSLVLKNVNRWLREGYKQSYCISLLVEHSQDIRLYELIRNEIRPRVQIGPVETSV